MQEMLIGEIFQGLEVIMATESFSAYWPDINSLVVHLSLQIMQEIKFYIK